MKKKMKSFMKRLFACFMCMVMVFSTMSVNAFAAEVEAQLDTGHKMMESVADMEEVNLEPVDSIASVNATSMYLGHVQFTGENWGLWRTIGDGSPTHVRMCIAFKPVDGIMYSTELFVYLFQYSNVYIGKMKCTTYTTEPDADGYYFFVSPYFTISPYSDCRIHYKATSSGTTYNPRTVDVHAWYDYY